MKAGVVHAREDIRFEEIEKPVPNDYSGRLAHALKRVQRMGIAV